MAGKSKGERDHFFCRTTKAVGDRIRQDTNNATIMTYSDHIAKIVSDHYGLPAFNDMASQPTQEQLPLPRSA